MWKHQIRGLNLCAALFASAMACFTHYSAADSSAAYTGIYLAQVVEPKVKIYSYRNKSGIASFSDKAPMDTSYKVIQYGCFACNVYSSVDWHNTPLYAKEYASTIESAAQKYRVDPALVRAIIHAESAFQPQARSSKGALGLMQLMPDTAREMGVRNALSPEENIRGGVRYLALMLEQNSGDTTLAAAAYNAGPNAVKQYNGIPPYEETQTYVTRVNILHERYSKAAASFAKS